MLDVVRPDVLSGLGAKDTAAPAASHGEPLVPQHIAGVPRPWPSVKRRRFEPTVVTVHTDRPNSTDARPLYVRGHRNLTVYSATR
jgi:hypothetical protein